MLRQTAVIAKKEIVDHSRETRSVASSLIVLLVGISMRRTAESKAAALFTGMTSIFVLVAVFTGGMNVAMDAIAGERERRSLLPLLLTSARRITVILGKWLATSVFSILGLTVTLLAFAAVFRVGKAVVASV